MACRYAIELGANPPPPPLLGDVVVSRGLLVLLLVCADDTGVARVEAVLTTSVVSLELDTPPSLGMRATSAEPRTCNVNVASISHELGRAMYRSSRDEQRRSVAREWVLSES